MRKKQRPKIFNQCLVMFLIILPLVGEAGNAETAIIKNETLINTVQSEGLKVTTFNAGLAHGFVAYAAQRQTKIIEDLANSDADVICIQEVWRDEDKEELITNLTSHYPHSFHTKNEAVLSDERPTCRLADVMSEDSYPLCIATQCLSGDEDVMNTCVLEECRPMLEALSESNQQCAQGILSLVGKNPVLGMLGLLNPFTKSDVVAYGGGNGLLVLSKKALVETEVVDMMDISTLTKRSALKVKVIENGKNNNFTCTHLSANLNSVVPYIGDHTSWENENYIQMQRLIESTADDEGASIVLGDFNCGFDFPKQGLKGDFTKSCQLMKDHGYEDLLPGTDQPSCTFCKTNKINAEHVELIDGNQMIDHIFIKHTTAKATQRSHDQIINIVEDDQQMEMHLSDHFGVTATIF